MTNFKFVPHECEKRYIGVDVFPAKTLIKPLKNLLPELRKAKVPVIWVNWGNRPDLLNISAGLLHVYNPTGNGIGLADPLPSNGVPGEHPILAIRPI